VVSLLPSFLCCSPIVPTLVGLLGLSATTRLRTTGTITYFFATKQDLLLLGALALVIGSGLWSMRKLARATCQAQEGCAIGDARRADAEGGAVAKDRTRDTETPPLASTDAGREASRR
jgi:hypothetical protein